MSGTSADGIDIAACDVNTSERTLRNLAATSYSYPEELRASVMALTAAESVPLTELMSLSVRLGYFYANSISRFIEENKIDRGKLDVIGSHGQTIAHVGTKQDLGGVGSYATLQIGEADIIAKETGIITISDFRNGDIAVGGAGAPLTPIYHALRFAESDRCRAIVNIGGIANVTLLKKDGSVTGSDSGPGNCLLDDLLTARTGKAYDKDGEISRQGTASHDLVDALCNHPLFAREIPRSYDRSETIRMLKQSEPGQRLQELSLEDAMSTLCHLTATTIRSTISTLAGKEWPDLILICGGGALNAHLTETLAQMVKPTSVISTERFGSDPQFVEAEAFAYLANLTLDSIPGNLPNITGARRSVILGKISQP